MKQQPTRLTHEQKIICNRKICVRGIISQKYQHAGSHLILITGQVPEALSNVSIIVKSTQRVRGRRWVQKGGLFDSKNRASCPPCCVASLYTTSGYNPACGLACLSVDENDFVLKCMGKKMRHDIHSNVSQYFCAVRLQGTFPTS